MKKLKRILLVTIIILLSFFGIRIIINQAIIIFSNNNIYNSKVSKLLYFLNITEPYIAYYNNGNVLYLEKDYEGAISSYKKALSQNPSDDRVCDIRINLSLATIKNIKNSSSDYKKIEELNTSRNYLYLDNCANRSNTGKSDEAEKLEDEITELISELENEEEEEQNNGGNSEEESEEEEKNVEQEIKERNSSASESREEELEYAKRIDEGYNDYDGIRWNGSTTITVPE